METCLVIDRGTTKIKAALYDFEGNELSVAAVKCPDPTMNVPEGWAEHDMNVLWELTVRAISMLFESSVYRKDSVKIIGLCGHGNGIYMIDKKGSPVRNAILSIDRRTNRYYGQWTEDDVLEKILKGTNGSGLDPQSPAVIMKWLSLFEKDSYDKIEYFFSSKDWIRFCLTGEVYTEYTETSANGLVNLESKKYADSTFELLGIPEANEKRAPLNESYAPAGFVTAEAAEITGLPKGTPVITGAHDVCACLLGTGSIRNDQLTIITGTLGINMATDSDCSVKSSMFYNSILPKLYSRGETSGGCASSLEWFINLLCSGEKEKAAVSGKSVFELVDPMLTTSRKSDILCLPYVFGGALTSMSLSGAFTNLSSWSNRADVLRAVYEGLVFAQCDAISRLPGCYDDIYIVGGCSASSLICSLFADVLNRRIIRPAFGEAACRGTAICAVNTYLGKRISQDTEISVPVRDVFEPGTDMSYLSEKYHTYKSAMRRVFA